MIRFELKNAHFYATEDGFSLFLFANLEAADARALQARELVDAAAALLEDDEGLADVFERLHECIDLLPGEGREPDDG